ncbi:M20/M25/M40 family metallo-hydrolase [Sphingobacterium paludis]|uniref:Carboxypeptidase Q n=1 Tax=Sphingobacterium paludis TaxID=1476465 RepID=A0A4R7CSL8_9SPHI|nr:M20/M25/M40 family metallo-hydrolase [Sphingobacterium paludis]TDS08446.1 Zn-dependent M28 family amino/carboxypeptidase [Sphingobacterium paludis]
MRISLFLLLTITSLHSFAQDQFAKAYAQIVTEVNQNSNAYTNLKQATESLGHRLTGSEQGEKAEKLAFDLLKSYGYDVRFQPFQMVSWQRKSLTLTIANQQVKAVALAHSPIEARTESSLVDMGNGLENDYMGKDVKGKTVLVYLQLLPGSAPGTKNLHRSEKTAIAIKHGAEAIVFVNAVPGGVLLTGTASITGDLITIPAACIGYEDGMAIKARLQKGDMLSAAMIMKNESARVNARNVIATLKGKSKEKIVVGGHLDSWDLATGAIDNGIGSFAVIDMARTLKRIKVKPKRTIEFVLFMGEEQGLLGSKAYVADAAAKNKLDDIAFMLNFDMTNAPTAFHSSREEMQNLYRDWMKQLHSVDSTFHGKVSFGAGLHSDHQPFMLVGLPYGGGAGGILPNNAGAYYHSDKDVFSLVDKKGLEQTVMLGAALAYSLANTAQIPAHRLSDGAIKDYLERNGLKTPLQVSGEWRWE